jgi:hypothetical protein
MNMIGIFSHIIISDLQKSGYSNVHMSIAWCGKETKKNHN